MKLENTVGMIGGALALAGCLLPVASRGALSLGVGEAGGLSFVLYACALVGLLVSVAALIGKMRKEEWVQIATGLIGLAVTFLLHRNLGDASSAFGLHLLYWGFAMLLAEGLIHFGEGRPRLGASA